MKCETVAQRAIAYGMPGIRVDGNDVLAVYAACKEAVERARQGEGPTLVECVTYRYTPHTTADDPKKYQTPEVREAWAKKEPLIRFSKYLREKGYLNDDVQKKLDDEIESTIKDAIQKMDVLVKTDECANPLHMFDYLYAEKPAFLVEQQKELAQILNMEIKPQVTGNPNKTPAGAK